MGCARAKTPQTQLPPFLPGAGMGDGGPGRGQASVCARRVDASSLPVSPGRGHMTRHRMRRHARPPSRGDAQWGQPHPTPSAACTPRRARRCRRSPFLSGLRGLGKERGPKPLQLPGHVLSGSRHPDALLSSPISRWGGGAPRDTQTARDSTFSGLSLAVWLVEVPPIFSDVPRSLFSWGSIPASVRGRRTGSHSHLLFRQEQPSCPADTPQRGGLPRPRVCVLGGRGPWGCLGGETQPPGAHFGGTDRGPSSQTLQLATMAETQTVVKRVLCNFQRTVCLGYLPGGQGRCMAKSRPGPAAPGEFQGLRAGWRRTREAGTHSRSPDPVVAGLLLCVKFY